MATTSDTVDNTINVETKTLDSLDKTVVETQNDSKNDYIEGWALAVVMAGLLLCLFLPALDQLILSEFWNIWFDGHVF